MSRTLRRYHRLHCWSMLNPADIHPGVVLRVTNSHGLGAPRGTLATVETVGTSPAGDWLCTLRYHDKRETRSVAGCTVRTWGRLILDALRSRRAVAAGGNGSSNLLRNPSSKPNPTRSSVRG